MYEFVREKTNNLGSDQVGYNPGCTVTEDGKRLEILDLESRGIVLSVSQKLICAFIFAYADCWFSHSGADMLNRLHKPVLDLTLRNEIILSYSIYP